MWGAPEEAPHCGHCSQCVERRLSVLAAGLADAADPAARYHSDPLVGERDGPALTYAERYVGVAREVERIESVAAFAARFPEVNDALPYLGGAPADAVARVYDLYRRHATGVRRGLREAVGRHLDRPDSQAFPARSLVGLTIVQRDPPPRAVTPGERGLVVDRDGYEVRYDGRPVVSRNTLEFRLFARLAQSPNRFVDFETLADEVWGKPKVRNNSIHRVVSRIRKCLGDMEIHDVRIEPRPAEYRLVVPPR